MKTLTPRRAWTDILKTLKDHRCQCRLLCPAKHPTPEMEKKKIFYNKVKFKQYLSIDSSLLVVIKENKSMKTQERKGR